MKKRILSGFLAGCLLVGLFTTAAATQATFSDVPSNAWYAQDLYEVQSYGIINGRGDGTFDPNGTLTAAEGLTLMAKVMAYFKGESLPVGNGTVWYENAIQYLASNGLPLGEFVSDIRSPVYGETCQRSILAYFLFFAAPIENYVKLNEIAEIPDINDLDQNTIEAITTLYEAGILTGNNAYGSFAPYSSITRAEVAVIVNRMLNPAKRKLFTLAPQPQITLTDFTGAYFAVDSDPEFEPDILVIEDCGSYSLASFYGSQSTYFENIVIEAKNLYENTIGCYDKSPFGNYITIIMNYTPASASAYQKDTVDVYVAGDEMTSFHMTLTRYTE